MLRMAVFLIMGGLPAPWQKSVESMIDRYLKIYRQMVQESDDYIKKNKILKAGQIAVTSAGNMKS